MFNFQQPLNPAHPYTGPLDESFKINPENGSLGYIDREHRYLQLPLERYSLFGSGHMEVTDNVEVFSEMRFSETHASSQGFVSQLFNVWSPTVPYNPAIDDPDSPTFGVRVSPTDTRHPVSREVGGPVELASDAERSLDLCRRPRLHPEFPHRDDGERLPDHRRRPWRRDGQQRDWNWEVYASHGKTSVNAQQPEGFPFQPRMQNLFNADQYGEDFDMLRCRASCRSP